MSLLWPEFLALLGLIPLIIAAYILVLRRRRRFAVSYSSLTLIREALPRQSWLRRHLPFALFLMALISLMLALGRPVAGLTVPAGRANVILAMDVSWSMCSTDIPPNRLATAQEAAQSFIQRQDASTQIGIVAFAGFAELIQAPTTDQEVLQSAVDGLSTGRWTAIGSAILSSLDAIAEINENVALSMDNASSVIEPAPVPAGEYAPDIIVLLTDGASNHGPDPLSAAQQAVDRGVRVYTIGFGTNNAQGSVMNCEDFQRNLYGGGPPPGSGSGFSSGFHRGVDEETLMQIADMTGGTYYTAESANELHEVFENLPTYLITKQETTEISVVFTALGALMAALAITLSFIWHPLA